MQEGLLGCSKRPAVVVVVVHEGQDEGSHFCHGDPKKRSLRLIRAEYQ